MLYRIEYANGRCCNFASSRKDLLEWLKILKAETITDIRKVYKSGATDSVLEKYKQFMGRGRDNVKTVYDSERSGRSSWGI